MHYKKESAAHTLNEQKMLVGVDIPIIEQDGIMLISASFLHKKLQVPTKFYDWINRKIEQYKFEKGLDYYSILSNRSDGKAGKRLNDYLLTMDTAKELAMLEENEIGRQIRRYFIEVEKRYRDWIGFILPRLEVSYDLFGQREGYNYLLLLKACGASTKSGSCTARIRKNYQEFWKNQGKDWIVSVSYGRAIITNAIARRLNAETKERRLNFYPNLGISKNKGGSHA